MATMDIAKTNNLYGLDIGELVMAAKQPQYIDYVDSDGKLVMNAQTRSVMVTAESDLADLPDIYAPGSVAFTADGAGKWQLGADGTWNSLVAETQVDTPDDNNGE